MDELIDELAQALDAIDKTALLYRELLLSYEEKKLTKKEIVQLSQALADYVTAGVALMGLLDANIEDNARDKWNSARLRLGDAQNVAIHTAKRYKKGFEDAQHLAEEDSVFRSIMSLIDGAYSDAMQHFEDYERMRDANRKKSTGPAILLTESKDIVKANPELLDIDSDTLLAKKLSEKSKRGLIFSRQYVGKYREKLEKSINK